MSRFHELRHRVARAHYQQGPKPRDGQTPWEELTRERQTPWLDDAHLAIIPILVACSETAESYSPLAGAEIRGLYVGHPDDDPMPCKNPA